MAPIPSLKLNSGYDFPLIGYGTYHEGTLDRVYDGCKYAIGCGYRHFDTAHIYKSEEVVGNAIIDSGIDRKDVFITTKLWGNFHEPQHVRPSLELSLKRLKTNYVDLYLVHWPISFEFRGYEFSDLDPPFGKAKPTNIPLMDTWRGMEKLVKDGLARSIGVSNYTIPMLEEILSQCEIPPAVNQVEVHPNLPNQELVDYCKSKNIAITGYAPIGSVALAKKTIRALDEPLIKKIAEKYDKTPAQVLLNWGVNRGYAVIPKSVTPSRIKENLVYFKMDQDDIDAITEVGLKGKYRVFDSTFVFGEDCSIFDDD